LPAIIGSHNLSKPAWGVEEKCGSQLYIRSYEVSILLTAIAELALINNIIGAPIAYTTDDEPWLADGEYTEMDDYGRQWINKKS